MLLLIRTPLVLHQQSSLQGKELLGPMVLRCLFPCYGSLCLFSSSGASQETEYLSFEPSYGGCLRQKAIDNLIWRGLSS